MLRYVKSELGSEATITHLAHAAMIVATLRLGGQDASVEEGQHTSTSLSSLCIINGRRFLSRDLELSKRYIPICQALGEVVLPDPEQYHASENMHISQRRKQVTRAAKVIGECYHAFQERKSILTESVPLMEYLDQEKFRSVLYD